jgi:flavin-dependent dehydrogenase
VIGGGLGGLAAALAAQRRGLSVTLAESHSYGRDKVCGEYLSAEAASDIDALGCGDWIDALGPLPMRRVVVIGASRGRASLGDPRLELAVPGPPSFSITRRAIEGFLVERARASGVTVLERSAVRSLEAERGLWRYRAGEVEGSAEVAICAFGKRSTLDSQLGLPRARRPETYAAAKVYLPGDPGALDADVELYLIPGGYVGLNPVEGGRIGLCALLPGRDATHDWETLRARLSESPPLRRRLEGLGAPLGPVRGLARFGFGAQKLVEVDAAAAACALFCGDAARMMPSFTGDGMAVAIRSGRLAAAAAAERDPGAAYTRAYEAEFHARLRFAGVLHEAFLRPSVFEALAPIVGRMPWLVQRLYALTRGR